VLHPDDGSKQSARELDARRYATVRSRTNADNNSRRGIDGQMDTQLLAAKPEKYRAPFH